MAKCKSCKKAEIVDKMQIDSQISWYKKYYGCKSEHLKSSGVLK